MLQRRVAPPIINPDNDCITFSCNGKMHIKKSESISKKCFVESSIRERTLFFLTTLFANSLFSCENSGLKSIKRECAKRECTFFFCSLSLCALSKMTENIGTFGERENFFFESEKKKSSLSEVILYRNAGQTVVHPVDDRQTISCSVDFQKNVVV